MYTFTLMEDFMKSTGIVRKVDELGRVVLPRASRYNGYKGEDHSKIC